MSSTTIEQSGLLSQKKNQTDSWNPPVPLTHGLNNETPYPFDALPNTLQQVVNAYQCYGQQPLSLVACGALANLSLACQSLANVARDSYLVSPVSLYFLVIASSGERKSAADNVFSKAIRQWEAAVRKKREPERLSALTQHKAWQMERDGLLTQIKRTVSTGEDSDYYKDLFDDLVHQEPDIPIQPTLYFEDATQEALAIHLATAGRVPHFGRMRQALFSAVTACNPTPCDLSPYSIVYGKGNLLQHIARPHKVLSLSTTPYLKPDDATPITGSND